MGEMLRHSSHRSSGHYLTIANNSLSHKLTNKVRHKPSLPWHFSDCLDGKLGPKFTDSYASVSLVHLGS